MQKWSPNKVISNTQTRSHETSPRSRCCRHRTKKAAPLVKQPKKIEFSRREKKNTHTHTTSSKRILRSSKKIPPSGSGAYRYKQHPWPKGCSSGCSPLNRVPKKGGEGPARCWRWWPRVSSEKKTRPARGPELDSLDDFLFFPRGGGGGATKKNLSARPKIREVW